MVKHKWSKNVVGARIGKNIYIHPELVKHPKLYEKILEHELEHTDGFEKHDIWHDINNKQLQGMKKEYWTFVIKHPRSMISFLPLMKMEGKWVMDLTLTAFWTAVILGGILLFKIL